MIFKIWIYSYLIQLLVQIALGDQVIGTYCPKAAKFQYCMILYKVEAGLTGRNAFDKCAHSGMEYLAIYDFNTQQHVEQLLNQSSIIAVGAWIAAHNVADAAAWQSIDPSSTFSYGNFPENQYQSGNNCLVGRFKYQDTPEYMAMPCNRKTDYCLICQVNSTSGCVGENNFQIESICYIWVPNSGSITWFEAQAICQRMFRGDILHELPPTYSSHVVLEYFLALQQYCWIGVWRYPWVWNTRVDDKPMRYFNWHPGAGSYSSSPKCAYTDNGFWTDVSCGVTLNHIICKTDNMEGLPATKSHPTDSPAHTDTGSMATSTVTEPHSHVTTVSQQNVEEEGFKLEYVAVLAVGVILVVVIVIVIVFIRKRKQKTSETPPNLHPSDQVSNDYMEISEYLSGTTNNQSAQPDNGQPDVTNTVSGYTNLDVAPVSHQVTSHGDEYALPNMNHPRTDHLDCIMVDNTQYGSYN